MQGDEYNLNLFTEARYAVIRLMGPPRLMEQTEAREAADRAVNRLPPPKETHSPQLATLSRDTMRMLLKNDPNHESSGSIAYATLSLFNAFIRAENAEIVDRRYKRKYAA